MESKSTMGIVAVIVVALVAIGGFMLLRNDDNKDTSTTNNNQSQQSQGENMNESKNIVEIASSDPQFSTLVTAVKAAGLVDTLSGEGPFTVFAPTNAAFDNLPAGTLDSLLKDTEKLKSILTYHVVAGDVKAADVIKLTSAKTVNGQDVVVKVDGSSVKINDSNVTKTDIATSNGTIHVIDTVLLPQ